MRILVTNDDGIRFEGIEYLAKWAATIGDVTVVAPKVQQSAKSHAIQLREPFEVLKVPFPYGIPAYSVDSTPGDCVRFGTKKLGPFDLILSGMNNGYNMGDDIMYSGTCGAVFEATVMGCKGIAFSTKPGNFEDAASHFDEIYQFLQTHHLLEINDLYNINIPPQAKRIRITKQGGPYFLDNFEEVSPNMFQAKGYLAHDNRHLEYLDTDSTIDGYISITPLTKSRTSPIFEQLKQLNP